MRLKVNKAEQRLEEAMKVTQEVEIKRTEAETEIQRSKSFLTTPSRPLASEMIPLGKE